MLLTLRRARLPLGVPLISFIGSIASVGALLLWITGIGENVAVLGVLSATVVFLIGASAWTSRRLLFDEDSALDSVHSIQDAVAGALARREYARLAFESVDEGLLIVDRDLRIVNANPVARRLAGAAGPLVGTAWRSACTLLDERLDPVDEAVDPVREAMSSGSRVQFDGQMHGEWGALPVQLTAVPVIAASGATDGCLIVIRDRSAQTRQLHVSAQLIAEVVHDLRTPLTSLQGFAELLQYDDTPPEVRNEWIGLIRSEAARMGGIIDDVLDLTRLQRDRATIHCDSFEVEHLVREALSPFSSSEVHLIDTRWESEGGTLHADSGKVSRALRNLVSNAMKYSPAGSTISITVGRDERDRVMFSVADQGPGIPEAERRRIFEPFYRAPQWESEASPISGTGLGLAIARSIARLHQGDLVVDCPTGGGSVFTLTIDKPGDCRHRVPVVKIA